MGDHHLASAGGPVREPSRLGLVDRQMSAAVSYELFSEQHRARQQSGQGGVALTKLGQLREARPSGVIRCHSRRAAAEVELTNYSACLRCT